MAKRREKTTEDLSAVAVKTIGEKAVAKRSTAIQQMKFMDKEGFKQILESTAGLTLEEHTLMMANVMQRSYYELSAHLYMVKTHEKYKEKYETIEQWAGEEFNWSRQRVYEYLDAFEITTKLLQFVPKILPANDFQARSLKGLDIDDLREAWDIVQQRVSDGEKLTAGLISRTVSDIKKIKKTANVGDEAVLDQEKEPTPAVLLDKEGNELPPPIQEPSQKSTIFSAAPEVEKRIEVMAAYLFAHLRENDFGANDIKDVALVLLDKASEL